MSENQTKEEIGKAAKQILDSFNFENMGKKVFEDFAKSWPYILIALAIAMVVSLLFLILLRFVAGILVWLLIIGVIGIIAYEITRHQSCRAAAYFPRPMEIT